MAYSSFDPRKTVRTVIGTSWWTDEEEDIYTINVTDNDNATIRIPILMSEEVKTDALDEMPYISMHLATVNYEQWDIAAATRQEDAHIDIGIWFTNTDNIDSTSFGKKIVDEIYDKIRSQQCTVFSATHKWDINIETVRIIEETKAHQVIFHIVMELFVRYYDVC
jgi:hypothetical protein